MTTSSHVQVHASIELEDFRRFAQDSKAVAVIEHSNKAEVIAVGTTPDGREVRWVQPGVDTAKHFLAALSRTYGEALAVQIAKELGLVSRPGETLASELVTRATQMAATARVALDGVDFVASLDASSVNKWAYVAAEKQNGR